MTSFRFYHTTAGGHVHLQVFAGPHPDQTHGKCGDMCMTVGEFEDFRNALEEGTQEPSYMYYAEVEFIEGNAAPDTPSITMLTAIRDKIAGGLCTLDGERLGAVLDGLAADLGLEVKP